MLRNVVFLFLSLDSAPLSRPVPADHLINPREMIARRSFEIQTTSLKWMIKRMSQFRLITTSQQWYFDSQGSQIGNFISPAGH